TGRRRTARVRGNRAAVVGVAHLIGPLVCLRVSGIGYVPGCHDSKILPRAHREDPIQLPSAHQKIGHAVASREPSSSPKGQFIESMGAQYLGNVEAGGSTAALRI